MWQEVAVAVAAFVGNVVHLWEVSVSNVFKKFFTAFWNNHNSLGGPHGTRSRWHQNLVTVVLV